MDVLDIKTFINENTLGDNIDRIISKLKIDENAKEKLLLLSQSNDPDVLHGLIEIAFEFNPEWSIYNLSDLLYSEYEEVRANFCSKLGFYKNSTGRALLEELLNSEKSDGVRCVAVMCLGEVGDLSTVNILQDIIKRDASLDYEGRRISDLAKDSILKIRKRLLS